MRRSVAGSIALSATLVVASARGGDVIAPVAPPLAPFRRGPAIEGTLGVYAPTGRLKNVSAPGPWMRITAGYDFGRWIAAYVAGDAAFLSTNRAPPPPGERAYVLYGFGGGVKVSIPLGERVRIPVRFELGAHRVSDGGVLGAYGFVGARDFGVSYGGMLGLEWRAASRHFGVVVEGGVRNDGALAQSGRSDNPLAIVAGLSLHYTL